jgi:hypothetical protein
LFIVQLSDISQTKQNKEADNLVTKEDADNLVTLVVINKDSHCANPCSIFYFLHHQIKQKKCGVRIAGGVVTRV